MSDQDLLAATLMRMAGSNIAPRPRGLMGFTGYFFLLEPRSGVSEAMGQVLCAVRFEGVPSKSGSQRAVKIREWQSTGARGRVEHRAS